jgi:hypothetical protein
MSRARLVIACLVAILLIGGSCGKGPSVPIKPIGAASTFQYSVETYRTSSTDKGDKDIQYIFDWGDGTKFDTTDAFASGETASATHAWSANQTYKVKALALNADGKTSSAWSDELEVAVGVNRKPGAPEEIIGPGSGIRNVKIPVWAKAEDPDGDSIYIAFYSDITNSPSKTNGWLGPVASGEFVYDTVRYTGVGIYELVAFARDLKGAISDSSPRKTIEIGPVGFAWSVVSENVGAFNYSPALRVVEGTKVQVFASSDDSLFRFTDDGSGSPTVSRDAFTNAEVVAIEGPTLSADNGRLYIPCDNGYLYVRDANTLGRVDSFSFDSSRTDFTPPAVNGSNLFIGRGETLYQLIDNVSGLSRGWAFYGKAEIQFPPAIGANGNIIFGNDSGVFCVDPLGSEIWRQNPGGAITTAFAIDANGFVYVGCEDSRLYKFDPALGTPTAISDTAGVNVFAGCPVIGEDGAVYVARSDGEVFCYEAGATLRWKADPILGATIAAAPCLAPDTTVIVHTEDDVLVGLRQGDGSEAWRVTLPSFKLGAAGSRRGSARRMVTDISSSPVVSPLYKRIYVGADNGGVFFSVGVDKESYGAGLPTSAPWPKYQHDFRCSGYKSGFWAY